MLFQSMYLHDGGIVGFQLQSLVNFFTMCRNTVTDKCLCGNYGKFSLLYS